MRIRDYLPSDFERLYEIDHAAFSAELAYSREELAHYVAARGGRTVVAEEGGGIVGFAVGGGRRGLGHIVTLDVAPQWQRQGIGSRLLAELEASLARQGARAIALETAVGEEGARHFYEKHGYVVVERIRGYYDGGLDAFLMIKRLSRAVRAP
ncbi:MAG TPA: GNAT family N-acetyltransferase [Thermoanaerobaculia bacterium]|nr:GNAT family N-acetyltransferase [Thermoanaerobaculia bacterium]